MEVDDPDQRVPRDVVAEKNILYDVLVPVEWPESTTFLVKLTRLAITVIKLQRNTG